MGEPSAWSPSPNTIRRKLSSPEGEVYEAEQYEYERPVTQSGYVLDAVGEWEYDLAPAEGGGGNIQDGGVEVVEMLEYLPPDPHGEGMDGYDEEEHVHIDLEIEKHRPYFTIFAIISCCLVFLWEMSKADWQFAPVALNPMMGPSTEVLVQCGAKVTLYIVDGQWWRLIVPIFLHAGVIHLALNMVMLWGVAQRLEEAMGSWRVGLVYMLSGIYGYVLSAIFLPQVPGVGASGAIFGVLGGLLGDYMHNHQYIVQDEKHKYLASLLLSSVLGLMLGLVPQFDNYGHFGGWIMGISTSAMLFSGTIKDPSSGEAHHKMGLVFTFSIITLVLFISGFTILYSQKDSESFCPNCKYLSCVPTPWWSCDSDLG